MTLLGACAAAPTTALRPTALGGGDYVSVDRSTVHEGFVDGSLRVDRDVPAYKISRRPVTWAEFDACVSAGQCTTADTSACGTVAYAPYPATNAGVKPAVPYDRKAPASPATCVGPQQAESYCHWVGGRLPRLS